MALAELQTRASLREPYSTAPPSTARLKWKLLFDPQAYGPEIAAILNLDGGGQRLAPLVAKHCSSAGARTQLKSHTARSLFPNSTAPDAALAGLWVYFSCTVEAHSIAQDDNSADGSYWHAILHRQEPDAGNAGYWFRRVGDHPIFPALAAEASRIIARFPGVEFSPRKSWDPYAFIQLCEDAREQPGSALEAAALEIQRAEWQLLFDYCARSKG